MEPSKWTVAQLREELEARGIDTSGKKSELAARLEAAMADLAIRHLGVTLLGTVEEERGRQEGACRGGGKPVSYFWATNSTPLPDDLSAHSASCPYPRYLTDDHADVSRAGNLALVDLGNALVKTGLSH